MSGLDDEPTAESFAPPSPLPGREDLSLLVLSGPDAGRYFRLAGDSGVIGRDPSSDVLLHDGAVSRRHASLERVEKARFMIRDLDSRFGTFVEGERVTEFPLADGQRIQFSPDTVVRVRYQDAKETEIFERLQEAAVRDPLTGVGNRRLLLDRLEQEFAFARRHNGSITVMMIDIDQFKSINDQHGHAMGDDVLSSVGRLLQRSVRVEDVVARYGGDEFVVLSRNTALEEGYRFAERLFHTIRAKPIRIGDATFHVTVSIGVAIFWKGDPQNRMDLLARADAALYVAKSRGRDRVERWSPELATPSICNDEADELS